MKFLNCIFRIDCFTNILNSSFIYSRGFYLFLTVADYYSEQSTFGLNILLFIKILRHFSAAHNFFGIVVFQNKSFEFLRICNFKNLKKNRCLIVVFFGNYSVKHFFLYNTEGFNVEFQSNSKINSLFYYYYFILNKQSYLI